MICTKSVNKPEVNNPAQTERRLDWATARSLVARVCDRSPGKQSRLGVGISPGCFTRITFAIVWPFVATGHSSAIRYKIHVMAGKSDDAFEITCPDCGAILRVDPETHAIVSHTSAPRKRMFEDFETAAKAMREHDERKESIFRQSVEAEKNKHQLFDKRFEEALRKAKESPDEGKPLRDFDLD